VNASRQPPAASRQPPAASRQPLGRLAAAAAAIPVNTFLADRFYVLF